jgi:hypothetical protein
LAQLCVGVGFRIGGQLIGSLEGVGEDLLTCHARPEVGFIPR